MHVVLGLHAVLIRTGGKECGFLETIQYGTAVMHILGLATY